MVGVEYVSIAQTLELKEIVRVSSKSGRMPYPRSRSKTRGCELEQVKREKDAAASDLESVMAYRGDNGDNLDTCQFCKNGQCYVRGGTKQCLPQWRGPKEGKEDA